MLRPKKVLSTIVSFISVAIGGLFAESAALNPSSPNNSSPDNSSMSACSEAGQIDWSKVPGSQHDKSNDVSQDFVAPSDPLNDILSNDFTAWEPNQSQMNGAFTNTGRAQRQAVLGGSSHQIHGAKSDC